MKNFFQKLWNKLQRRNIFDLPVSTSKLKGSLFASPLRTTPFTMYLVPEFNPVNDTTGFSVLLTTSLWMNIIANCSCDQSLAKLNNQNKQTTTVRIISSGELLGEIDISTESNVVSLDGSNWTVTEASPWPTCVIDSKGSGSGINIKVYTLDFTLSTHNLKFHWL